MTWTSLSHSSRRDTLTLFSLLVQQASHPGTHVANCLLSQATASNVPPLPPRSLTQRNQGHDNHSNPYYLPFILPSEVSRGNQSNLQGIACNNREDRNSINTESSDPPFQSAQQTSLQQEPSIHHHRSCPTVTTDCMSQVADRDQQDLGTSRYTNLVALGHTALAAEH